ncbi:MAG: hypothetical protein QHH10_02415 [Peptococcaceae bacterium]|nr:hypothetical protein [Peptococcaceae bacterium]
MQIQEDELLIYAGFCDILLARHKICLEKGKLIQNNNHLRNKNIKIAGMKEALKARFLDPATAEKYLDRIHAGKKRYVRDQFQLIEKTISQYSSEAVDAALQYCLTNELNSAVDFRDAVIHFSQGIKETENKSVPSDIHTTNNSSLPSLKVAKRNLQDMINCLKGGAGTWLN